MPEAPAWILGRRNLDFPFILLPGIAGICLSSVLPASSTAYLVYAFLAIAIIDSGHVYLTLWRTIFRKEERGTNITYWLTPLATLAVVSFWISAGIPHIWSAVVYATIFHHIRQFYGIARWYQKLNGRYCLCSNSFLYALSILPFVLFHFRAVPPIEYYTGKDLFLFPSAAHFRTGLALYGIVVCLWLAWELRLYRRGVRELNRFLAVLTPALVYAFCFLKGANAAEVILPLLLAHGIPYFALTDLSLRRLNPGLNIPLAFLLTLALCVPLEIWLEEDILITMTSRYPFLELPFWQAMLTGAFLTPLICHYVWDAHIWTGRHREAKVVFRRVPSN